MFSVYIRVNCVWMLNFRPVILMLNITVAITHESINIPGEMHLFMYLQYNKGRNIAP